MSDPKKRERVQKGNLAVDKANARKVVPSVHPLIEQLKPAKKKIAVELQEASPEEVEELLEELEEEMKKK